ncbi:1-acyl-sn-glycerol-3-phosphate acyltransferase [Geodermatophilus sabuli]|nr:1-acyl-sn-glycerol-3-phosphate acyltransferase [Geodermatophilus sabuli]
MLPPTSSRWLRAGAVLAAQRLRPPVGSARRRAVCGAARLLAGLGLRVDVRPPAVPWPRTGPGPGALLVTNSVSPLDPLVLLTAVPGVVIATAGPQRVAGVPCPTVPATVAGVRAALARGTSVVIRPEQPAGGRAALGRFSPELFAAALATGAPVCPVALRYGGDGGAPPPAPGGRTLLAALRWIGATRDVVVAVRPLPALGSSGATATELAALAEYAVAAVLEAPLPARPGGLAAGPRPEPARRVGQQSRPTR